MASRVVERLSGVGEVYAGEVLLRKTAYRLTVWAEDASPSTLNVEGHIDITGIGEAVVLAGPGVLTLYLEDGRRLPFMLTTSTGRIEGKGGFHSGDPPART